MKSKIKIFIAIILLFIIIFPIYCQSTFFRYDQTEIGRLVFKDGMQSTRGDYYILGEYGFGIERTKYRIIVYDSLGQHDTDFIYPIDYFELSMYEIEVLKGGEIYIYGEGESYSGSGIFNILFDKDGSVVWKNSKDYWLTDLFPLDDSFFIAIKRIHVLIDDSSWVENKIVKINYYGKVVWEVSENKLLGSENCTRYHKAVRNIYFDSDTVYVFCKLKRETEYMLVRLSNQGELIRRDTFELDPNMNFLIYKGKCYLYGTPLVSDDKSIYKIISLNKQLSTNWEFTDSISHYALVKDVIYSQSKIIILLNHRDTNAVDEKQFSEVVALKGMGDVDKRKMIKVKGKKLILKKIQITSNGGYFMFGNLTWLPDDDKYWSGVILKTDSAFQIFGKSLNLTETDFSHDISIFPNPLTNTATFKLPIQSKQNEVFRLYSLTGRLVREAKITGSSYLFHRNNLPVGMYIYSITGSVQRLVGKLMIE